MKRNRPLCAAALLCSALVWGAMPLAAQAPIVANPTKLSFVHQISRPIPPQQTINVSGPVGQTVNVATNQSWLFVNTVQGQASFDVNVIVLPTGLTAGNYAGNVTLTSTGAPNSPLVIPVSLTVSTSTLLSVSSAVLNFSHTLNGTPPEAKNLTVATTDDSSLGVSAAAATDSGGPWLSVEPNAATAPTTLSVSVNVGALGAGTYTGRVIVAAAGAANSPVTVDVVLTIAGEVSLTATPASLSFVYQVDGPPPPNQAVAVASTGEAAAFTVATSTASGGQWLSASPTNGTTPGNLSIGVTPSGLAAGAYQGTVTIQSASAPGGPVTVAVTLTVTSEPVLVAEPTALSFVFQTGGSAPAPQMLVVSNPGNPLSLTVAATTAGGGNWLSAAPTSTSTPVALLVSVNMAGLAPGTYTGSVVLTAAGAANSPLNVPVTLTISATPLLRLSRTSATFHYTTGGAAATARAVSVTSTGAAISYNTSVSTAAGGNWLVATQDSNSTPSEVIISVNPDGLATGVYTGTVQLAPSQQGGLARTISVRLTVSAAAIFTVDTAPLTFNFATGTSAPANQQIPVNSTGAAFGYSATVTTLSGIGWLVISPSTGQTGQPITVGVNTSIGAGNYVGLITVSSSGVANSPQYVPVLFRVTADSALQISPGPLTFTQVSGAAPPLAQKLIVASTGTILTVNASVSTLTGGNWLSVTPNSGLTQLEINVNVNAGSLQAGTYTGAILIQAAGAVNSPQSVPVTLNVVSPTTPLVALPASLTFSYTLGGTAPPAQNIQLSAATPLQFMATAGTTGGGTWLQVSPASGSTPGPLTVSINTANLNVGVLSGSIVVEAAGASNSPLQIPVTLTVSAAPMTLTVFRHAASYAPVTAVPGMIVSVGGVGLGPAVGQSGQVVNGRLTTLVAGVRVLFDGIPAPLLYVSSGQINAVVPYEVAGRFATRVEVEYQGARSNALDQRVAETAPGIFTLNAQGFGEGAILNENYSINTAGNPAPRGSAVIIYATGEGQTTPFGDTGLVIGGLLKRPLADVRVRIGGAEAAVIYAGSGPGLVSGALQVNALVPLGIAPNAAAPVELIIGGVPSQAGVTVAVQ
jgi:uncharacterized protein (TIGR03437 family)